jgi:hypothetical protein
MAGTIPISDDTFPPIQPSVVQANTAAERDLWIFRDGRASFNGPELLGELRSRLAAPLEDSALLDALIQAGELEAALADADHVNAAECARVTDGLAALLCGSVAVDVRSIQQVLDRMQVPNSVSIAPPEGFTYYALHPSDFTKILPSVPVDLRSCAVVGIRSIGTTLSAVVLAALRAHGTEASRITVRPTGHPYSRQTQFSTEQQTWIVSNVRNGSHFLVVDEGPGRSGSTFLSVAEALDQAGVPRESITILGSRHPDVSSLCADDAAARWQAFRFISTVPSTNRRLENCTYIGGGAWRDFFLLDPATWPATWTQMERLKFLAPDWKTLYKFEGMGPLGAEARNRAFQLAKAGFGPAVSDAGDGYLAYDLLSGIRPSAANGTMTILDRIAEYCAFRASEFHMVSPQPGELTDMVLYNVRQEFGIEVQIPPGVLQSNRPVITDGRMQSFEWIQTVSGQLIKTDGVDHGNNHFFPGPCDIAWDLAGAAVEWQLAPDARQYLVDRFRRLSGTDVTEKLPFYQLAYCVFRLGSCKMAISTVKGSPEEFRLTHAYLAYRHEAMRILATIQAGN